MEILSIGPLELLFILTLVLINFGPKEIEKTSKKIGKRLTKFIRSVTWKTINLTSQEIKTLPDRFMRGAASRCPSGAGVLRNAPWDCVAAYSGFTP